LEDAIMKGTIIAAAVVTIGVMLGGAVSAKGRTTRITIVDTVSGQSADITDESVLGQFNVWSGPGTFVNGVEDTQGFIIDWPAGTVPRPAGVRRYEVRFYTEGRHSDDGQPAYMVYYEHDAASRHGFVYLPGRADEPYRGNVRSILRGHGFEGNWFRSTSGWERAIQSVIPAP
jgi:hypothetical protein